MAVSYLHPEPPANHAFPVRRQTAVLDSHPSYSAYPCRNLPHYPLPDGGADAPDAQAEIHSAHTQNQITATGCLVFICSGYYLQHGCGIAHRTLPSDYAASSRGIRKEKG